MTPHPLPFINLCHLHTNIHSLTHTQADTYASMQYLQLSLSSPAWTPSITLSPPPPASSQPYPSFSSFPPHLCTLASSLSNPPFHFFPGLTSRLAWKGKKTTTKNKQQPPSPQKNPNSTFTWCSVSLRGCLTSCAFELGLLCSVHLEESQCVQREGRVFEVCAHFCPRARMHLCQSVCRIEGNEGVGVEEAA